MELEVKLLYEPVCPSVRRLVGCLVRHNFLKGAGNFTSHALIGSLVYIFRSCVPSFLLSFLDLSSSLLPRSFFPACPSLHTDYRDLGIEKLCIYRGLRSWTSAPGPSLLFPLVNFREGGKTLCAHRHTSRHTHTHTQQCLLTLSTLSISIFISISICNYLFIPSTFKSIFL